MYLPMYIHILIQNNLHSSDSDMYFVLSIYSGLKALTRTMNPLDFGAIECVIHDCFLSWLGHYIEGFFWWGDAHKTKNYSLSQAANKFFKIKVIRYFDNRFAID